MPLVIVISAFVFNLFNGFFVGYEIGNISQLDFGINYIDWTNCLFYRNVH